MDLRSVVDTTDLRRRRYERLASEVGLRPSDRILELGCGPGDRSIAIWNRTNQIIGIDLLDPSLVDVVDRPNFSYRRCDARNMAIFADRAFDVAIGVGLLEHVTPRADLEKAVRETQRVAALYAFVVPHRYAFIEPHYQLPFIPLWPDWLRRVVLRAVHRRWKQLNWLTANEWRRIFRDHTVRLLDHWYGPLLMYRLIVGGYRGPRT